MIITVGRDEREREREREGNVGGKRKRKGRWDDLDDHG
jgi:hypothetical protein